MRNQRRRRILILRILFLVLASVLGFVAFYRLLFGVAPEFDFSLPAINTDVGGAPQFLRGRHRCAKKWFTACGSPNRVDWHNATQIELEKLRMGPGEQGQAISMSPEDDTEKEKLYQVNGFNALGSDRIALNRSIPDIRHAKCRERFYDADLPTVSVIVPFHNEHWSTLLRTAVTVIDRSPAHILREVILVDDFSTKDFLKSKLDDYVSEHLPKVRILRAKRREGLIRTRLLGAREAIGDVIIYLDSHSEANVNWLPPLLEPIARNYRAVVCPYIDVIDYETFQYRAQDEGARGAFDWEMFYKRLPVLPADEKNMPEPFKSPVMAGGLFAISQKFFWELGGYDEGLDIWGGEQYELSFKLWQCGGEMYDAPCSRVGHIYRKFAPFPNPGVGDFVGRNLKRVAEVWMDEYAQYIYARRKNYLTLDAGNLTVQRALRERLQCKPFSWFMKTIAFDLPKKYPPVEPPDYAWGELRLLDTKMCVDTKFGRQNERFGLRTCGKDDPSSGGEQQMSLTWHKDIRPGKRTMCFDVSSSEPHAPVVLYGCHGSQGNQQWQYLVATKQLFHRISRQCLGL